jgi:hypothetical protein
MCSSGINWWLVGGIAAGIGLLGIIISKIKIKIQNVQMVGILLIV